MTRTDRAPGRGFLAVVERRLLRVESGRLPTPAGAARDGDGRWVVGDILLTGRAPAGSSPDRAERSTDAAFVLATIAQWGSAAPEHLRGEYCLVAWDAPRRTLLAARDGIGLRLLYVACTDTALAFSDDVAQLAGHSGADVSFDAGALAAFLVDGTDEDVTRTVYRGVRAIPAGHTVTWTSDATAAGSRRHWQFPSPLVMGRRAARDLPARFNATLDAAVGDRLRAPTASILLSGGIDSASIAASVRRVRPDVALTGVTSTYAPLIAELELPWTRRVADHLGIPLEAVPCASQPPLGVGVAGPPLPLDEPTWLEWCATVARAAAWSETILYGEDGDALFLPATLGEMLRAERWPGVAGAILCHALHHGRLPFLGTGWRRHFGAPLVDVMRPRPPWLRATVRTAAEPAPFVSVQAADASPHRDWPRRRLTSPLVQSLSRAMSGASTGVAATFRLPLMDDRVLALAMAAPSVPWLQGKRLIRVAAAHARALPPEIIWRPKTPVRGHHEALVALWRSRWDGTVAVAPELQEWVDVAILRDTLRRDSDFAVSDAWRVLELSAWLGQHRRGGG